MAKIDIKINDNDFLIKLLKFSNKTDMATEEVLKAGANIVYDKVKSNLSSVIGRTKNSRSTGELINSLGISPVKINRSGNYNIKVGLREPRIN